MRIASVTCLLLLVSLLFAAQVGAVEVGGRSSTQLLWYNTYYQGKQVDLAEYLRLSITKVDEAGKLSFYGYGRGVQDLNNGTGANGRLYYLYGQYTDLFDKLDIKIGREYANLSAGSVIIDGAQVDLKNIGPVGFTVFGGRNVIFGESGELSKAGDYALGMSAYLTGFRNTFLDVSWLRTWTQGDVGTDVLGASFNQYLLNMFRLYGNVRYDLTSEVFNEVLVGVKYFPLAHLVLTGEWYQSYPIFDTTSIYSVFAVNRFQNAVFRADYTINEKVAVRGGFTWESYENDGNAQVLEIGCTLRPLTGLSIDASYDYRTGYGGKINGGGLDVTYDYNKQVQLAAGFMIDAYKKNFFPGPYSDEVAQKYWLGGRYQIAKNMNAQVRLEDDINENWDTNIQGRIIFNYDF
jgi:hypothetical protein